MTSHSPNGLASHNASGYSEEDDKAVFKSPSDTSRSGSGFAKQASLSGKDTPGGSTDVTGAHWNGSATGARNPGESDPTWELTGRVKNMKLSDGGKADGDTAGKASTNGVLAPAAEIQEGGQQAPHSRHSSGASSFDSPAIPTPGGKLQSANDRNVKGPYPGYGGYGYDVQDSFNGITNVLQSNGLTNGIGSPPMHYPQAGIHPSLSPLVNGGGQSGPMGGPLPPFSPPLPGHMGHTPMSPQSQQMYQGADFGADAFGIQQRMNPRGGAGRGNGNAGSGFGAFNGQAANGNASGFAYGSPPPQGFNPGLMSPTMTSPTFLPTQGLPYSPIHGPTPYSPYVPSQPLGGTGQMFDMMSNPAMSPQSQIAMLPGRNQTALRGHGYSASNPANMHDGTANAQSPTRGGPRAQPPRGAAPTALNHAHSLSLPHTPFSPQLGPVAYGPMSPPPYPNFYPGMVPPQGLTPELLQAITQSPQRNGGAFNPAIQTALGTLQQDPSVLALIQQGGDGSPSNGGVNEKVIAEAVARALTTYGLPASSQPPRIEPPAEPVATPTQTTSAFSGFSTRNTSTPANGVGGGHHRVSASVDFGRSGRGLGSDLSLGLGSGMGHQRNPSASSVVPSFASLSRTPLSGQSSPFGEGSSSRGVTAGSALLESHP
ncbi:hypothetical protein FRB90_004931, partial [Tulasnella sp. 427]